MDWLLKSQGYKRTLSCLVLLAVVALRYFGHNIEASGVEGVANSLGLVAPISSVELLAALLAGIAVVHPLVQFLANKAAVKASVVVLLVSGLGLVFQGCASTQLAKKDGTVALSVAHSALDLVEVTLLRIECDKAGAPAAPACIPADAADRAFVLIAKAAGVGHEASLALREMPPSLDTSTGYSKIRPFLTQIWNLIVEIQGLLPSSSAATRLGSDLAVLQSKS